MTDYQQIMLSEAEYVLQYLADIFPNTEKMIAVYYDKSKRSLSALLRDNSSLSPAPLEFGEDFDYFALERMRLRSGKFFWTGENNLPFSHSKTPAAQIEVFQEAENTVLVTGIKNRSDKKQDLYFIYFNKDATNFGPVRNDEILNTISKNVIENTVFNVINMARRERDNRLASHAKFKTFIGRLRDKAKTQAAKLSATENRTKEMKVDFCKYVLAKLSSPHNTDITLSPEAEKVVADFPGDFEAMEKWIKDAYDFAVFSDFDTGEPMLIIEDWHFSEPETGKTKPQATDSAPVEGRYFKTFNLLNKLEDAAVKVVASRKKLTGSAVGQAMDQAISAPAITDALKKHSKKIISLMEQYPDRWTLIRNEFRPVLNVLESKRGNSQKTA
jgi:hypothetical protein